MKRNILRWMSYSVICAVATGALTGCIDSQSSATAPEQQVASVESPELVDAGDYYLWQGDMLLQKSDPVHAKIIAEIQGSKSSLAARSQMFATGPTFKKWANGVVPYYFSGTNWTAADKDAFRQAMASYSDVAQISFVEQSQPGLYVLSLTKLPPAGGCGVGGSSSVGYVSYPVINIAPDQTTNLMVLRHELGHTLGFEHEHSRPNRDQFIKVNINNVMPGLRNQFDIITGSILPGSPYDVKSIMHYKSYSQAPAGCAVYDPAQPILTTIYGGNIYNTDLSNLDRQAVAKAYGGKYPMGYLTDDATMLTSKPTASAPTDIGASSTHLYLKYASSIQQLGMSNLAVVKTVNQSLDAIDYVDAAWGLIGASNAERRVYVNIFGNKQSYPYPANIASVKAFSGRVVNGQLRVVFTIPGTYYGSKHVEFALINGQWGGMYSPVQTGMYDGTDLALDGVNNYGTSGYYFKYFYRSNSLASYGTNATFSNGFTLHGYQVKGTLDYYSVSPSKIDWTTRNGVGGVYALNPRGTNVDVIWLPLTF